MSGGLTTRSVRECTQNSLFGIFFPFLNAYVTRWSLPHTAQR